MEFSCAWKAFVLTQSKAKNLISYQNVPLSSLSSFRIGGTAKQLIYPQNAQTLCDAVARLEQEGIPYFVIGNATNLLFADEGFCGVIVATRDLCDLARIGNTVTVSAGMSLPRLAFFAKWCGLSGLEFACNIPASVGGAVCQNAGAFGHSIAEVLRESCAYRIAEKKLVFYDADAHHFDYRKSIYQKKEDILLSATFALTPKPIAEIDRMQTEYIEKRKATQPREPSAGSVFLKTPDGKSAGYYIERAGLKGYRIGGAAVSQKHAGFLINQTGASCADMTALMQHCKQTVYEQFGISLCEEVLCVPYQGI